MAAAGSQVSGSALDAAVLALSPLGYWKLDEPSGTTAVDSSGNGRDGTYSGTYTLANWTGDNGELYADFGGGRVSIGDNNVWSANTASGLTILAFIRPEAAELASAQARFIVAKGSSGQYEYSMFLGGVAGRIRQDFYDGSGSNMSHESTSGALTTPDVWNMVVSASVAPVYTQRFDLYVDSSTPVTSTQGAVSNVSYANGTAALQIGNRADNVANTWWNGGLANVALFAGKLNSTQVGSIRTGALADGWTV
jgi:hypothetical protein